MQICLCKNILWFGRLRFIIALWEGGSFEESLNLKTSKRVNQQLDEYANFLLQSKSLQGFLIGAVIIIAAHQHYQQSF